MTISSREGIIRPASEADYQSIADIFTSNVQARDCTLWEKDFSPDDIKSMVAGFDDREKMFVYEADRRVIGWGMIRKYHQKMGYAFACETSVFFDRTETGKGYGTRLKSFILEECRVLGYHHVNAKIMAQNKVSINYNLKLGYEIVGIQKEIGYRDGKWIDVVIMQFVFA